MSETLKVLQLDDSDPEIQEVAHAVMRDGLVPEVTAVADLQGLRKTLADGIAFDVVFAEPEVTEQDPLGMLDMVRGARHPAPVIFVARRADDRLAEEAVRRGAIGFVLKRDLERLAPLLRLIDAGASPPPGFELLARAGDPALVLDDRHAIYFVNRAFVRRSGIPRSAALGRPILGLAGGDAVFLEALRKASPEIGSRKTVGHVADGHECWLDVQWLDLPSDAHRYRVLLAREVTQGHRDEEAVQRLQEQLVRSQKQQSVAVLASGIAHDFNNILTGIFGSAELARLSLSPDHPAYADLDTIVHASQRAAELTKELLSYASKGARGAEVVDINQMVTNILVILRSQVSKSIIVRKALAPRVPKVLVNAPEIQQVLMNLCLNASEAMAERGGILSIVTDHVVLDRAGCRRIEHGVPEPGEYATFEVVDTGPGIADEVRPFLFQPFFSTKGRDRGLGLAAVLRIVTAHGGAMDIRSNPDEGTVVRVLLPATLSRPPEPGLRTHKVARRQQTILFVDDEEMLRSLGKRGLEHLGYRVLLAADGIEAVRLYREHLAEIDLVVLDLSMPRKGGEDAYQEMRTVRADVRILLSCGYDQQSAAEKFAPGNLVGFLAKPFGMDQLAEQVERALSKDRKKS